jgi:hypothetical protein
MGPASFCVFTTLGLFSVFVLSVFCIARVPLEEASVFYCMLALFVMKISMYSMTVAVIEHLLRFLFAFLCHIIELRNVSSNAAASYYKRAEKELDNEAMQREMHVKVGVAMLKVLELELETRQNAARRSHACAAGTAGSPSSSGGDVVAMEEDLAGNSSSVAEKASSSAVSSSGCSAASTA